VVSFALRHSIDYRFDPEERIGSCTSNNTGIALTNPTLTPLSQGQSAKCVFTGEPIFDVSWDPNLAEEDQLHFNPRAFAMASPIGPMVGNCGNVPNGIFRHPGWWNWDVTFARRFSVRVLGYGAQVRLQVQLYNIFNMVQFTNLDTHLQIQDDPSVPGVDNLLLTSTTHGRYTTTNNNIVTTPPRQIGLTLGLDFQPA
jgi:hypothetical protein